MQFWYNALHPCAEKVLGVLGFLAQRLIATVQFVKVDCGATVAGRVGGAGVIFKLRVIWLGGRQCPATGSRQSMVITCCTLQHQVTVMCVCVSTHVCVLSLIHI